MAGTKRRLKHELFVACLAISIALCAGLSACYHSRPNTVVTFLQGAEQQWETQEQGREIEKALNDMLALKPDELRNRRYANYQMQPGAWSIIELLHRYFVSRGPVYLDENRFYQDMTDPAAKAVIRQHVQVVKESIPLHPTLDAEDGDGEEDETE
jgi:hypothetical protein